MKNKVFFIIGLVLLVAGAIFGYFASIPAAEITGLAVSSLGLAVTIVSIVKKTEKKDWKLYVSIVGIVVGAFILGLMGITEDKLKTLITGVIGIVVLIASIIPMLVVSKKESDKVENKKA